MHYLKIFNTVLNNDYIYILKQMSEKLKNGTVGQAVFELLIKMFKVLFWSITREPLGLPKLFFKKCWQVLDIVLNILSFGLRCSFPLMIIQSLLKYLLY